MFDPFASGPAVWSIGNRLYARTPFLMRALSLFSYNRLLRIDRSSREVFLSTGWFWWIRREQTIPFARVEYIDLDYSSLSLGSDRDFQRCHLMESYRVNLVLKEPRETVRLFRFAGEPISVEDDLLSRYVTSEDRTRAAAARFIDALAKVLEVPVGPPVKHYSTVDGAKFFCSECGRKAGPGSKSCVYCGGSLDAVIAAQEAER